MTPPRTPSVPPRVGYACLALAVPGTALSACSLATAAAHPDRPVEVALANLAAVEAMVDYNAHVGIRLYRLSSDLVPLATHPSRPVDLAAALAGPLAPALSRIGTALRESSQRVSMHPGQYTVLNTPMPDVLFRSVDELRYHAALLDALGAGCEARLILHVGGGYGDKPAAMERFVRSVRALPENVRCRMTVENDDRIFTPADVLEVATALSIPAVYDNLHAALNPSGGDDALWTARFAATWKPGNGPQKVHYSQQAPDRRGGSHSDAILAAPFLAHVAQLRASLGDAALPDLMLEVKDKNVSAVKAALLVDQLLRPDARAAVRRLESEWAKTKYRVLARSEREYDAIRQLLKDKAPVDPFALAARYYEHVETALARPENPGAEVNAAEHVWGYFKKTATPADRRRFDALLGKYRAGQATAVQVRALLARLADREGERYLQESYYFLG